MIISIEVDISDVMYNIPFYRRHPKLAFQIDVEKLVFDVPHSR